MRPLVRARKLAATVPLSTQRLQSELSSIEDKILAGRRDEAIGDLVYLVESPRFDPFAKSDEGRAALFLLGDSLGRAGAYEPGRAYLGAMQAARLAVMLPAPKRFEKRPNSAYVIGRAGTIAARMGAIDPP